jgi:hypothetical protein
MVEPQIIFVAPAGRPFTVSVLLNVEEEMLIVPLLAVTAPVTVLLLLMLRVPLLVSVPVSVPPVTCNVPPLLIVTFPVMWPDAGRM